MPLRFLIILAVTYKKRDCDDVLIPQCAYVNSCFWEEWRHKFLLVFHVERLKEKVGSKVTCGYVLNECFANNLFVIFSHPHLLLLRPRFPFFFFFPVYVYLFVL